MYLVNWRCERPWSGFELPCLVSQWVSLSIFLRLQKIKNEVKTSIEELDRDEFLGLDEAFEIATTKHAQH
jgi:hypothetical protein